VGRDTRRVLCEVAGLSEAEVDRLQTLGVILQSDPQDSTTQSTK